MELDPSSISLFATTSAAADEEDFDEKHDELAPSSSQLASTSRVIDQIQDGSKGSVSYTKYTQKKNADAASRRNLLERMERLKSSQGLKFTIPQLKQATMFQLTTFLRRLKRSNDVNNLISEEILDKIFITEAKLKQQEQATKPADGSSDLAAQQKKKTTIVVEADRTAYSALVQNELTAFKEEERLLFGRQRLMPPPMHSASAQLFTDDEEATDEEIVDYEDDDLFGLRTNLSHEFFDLLEERAQILMADKHARRIQEEIAKKRLDVEAMLNDIDDSPIFQMPPSTPSTLPEPTVLRPNYDDDDGGDKTVDDSTMTCARCRPVPVELMAGAFSRDLVIHDFSSTVERPIKPIISYKKCGTREYADADDSIHPMLSTYSAIPMDAQLQKYLHVISFIPTEIETRRHQTAQAFLASTGKDMKRKFYNTSADNQDDQQHTSKHDWPEATKGIKLSLGKKSQKRDRKMGSDDSDATSDQNDPEFRLLTSLANKKRRCMTMDHHPVKKYSTTKPSKMEGRRMSHIEFGASMFDYDAQLMDIGLPLPAINKVESVEIAIPSFRKKKALCQTLPACVECDRCQSLADPWAEIKRLHGDLERQEKQQRFRPQTSATARKMTGPANLEQSNQQHRQTAGTLDNGNEQQQIGVAAEHAEQGLQ